MLQHSSDELAVNAQREQSLLRQILHGSAWYSVAILVNRFIPGVQTVILAWWLGPRELGIVSFVLGYYCIFSSIADWSIAYAVQKLIPENSGRAGQVAWTAFFTRLVFSLALGLTCWGLDVAAGAFHGYGFYLALLIAASTFGIIVYLQNALCHFAAGSLFSIAIYVVWLPLTLILVKLGMRTTGPLLGLCIGFAASGIPGLLLTDKLRGQMAFIRPIAVKILRFGTWGTLATLLSALVDQAGILVLACRVGDTSAGVFKVAATFGILPALLGMIVMLPLMPVAKQILLKRDAVSSSLIRPLIRYLLMLGLPIVTAGFVLAEAVVRTFVGESYLEAVWPIRILLGASLLRMLVIAFSGLLFLGEDLKALAQIHGTIAAIALIGSLALAHSGVTAVAFVYFVSWLAGAALLYRFFEERGPLHLEWGRYLRYSGSAIVTAGLALSASQCVHAAVSQLVLGGCMAGLVYTLLMLLQRDLLIPAKLLSLFDSAHNS